MKSTNRVLYYIIEILAIMAANINHFSQIAKFSGAKCIFLILFYGFPTKTRIFAR